MQCDDTGLCSCRSTITGRLCDVCVDGYYDLSDQGCRLGYNTLLYTFT